MPKCGPKNRGTALTKRDSDDFMEEVKRMMYMDRVSHHDLERNTEQED